MRKIAANVLGMGDPGKGKVQLGITFSRERDAYLFQRAESLGWSRAQVINTIVDFWLALDAPPLNDLESRSPIAKIPGEVRVPMIEAWAKYSGQHEPISQSIRS